MKLPIGVDDTLGLIHSLETTPASAGSGLVHRDASGQARGAAGEVTASCVGKDEGEHTREGGASVSPALAGFCGIRLGYSEVP